MIDKKFPKIGLALSGGGAKGFAHISVITNLEKLGIPIFCVAGTSMGALIGGWYVAGKDFNTLLDLARKGDWKKFLHIRELVSSIRFGGGLFFLDSFKKFLEKELNGLKIEDLKTKYCAVATSLATGKKVILKDGELDEAILASGCLPVIFSPIKINNDLLVDGGVVDNFPVEACFEMGAEFVIGVDVRFAPGYLHEEIRDDRSQSQWKIFKVLQYLMEAVNVQTEKKETGNLVIIKPYISHVSTFDFQKADEVLKLGDEAFKEKEDELREKLGLPERKKNLWETILGE